MKIELLQTTQSTNRYVKQYLDGGEDVIVCAKSQTDGMGTKGRTFLSKEGGIYLSALTFYRNFPAKDSFRVMINSATAVCKTVETFGLTPQIKWPNDILVNGKKICGILIETVLCGQILRASIVGIGLNVCNRLDGLESIATSICEQANGRISVEEVRDVLIQNLQKQYSFAQYASYLHFLGKVVTVCVGEQCYTATAIRVLDDGRLLVRTEEGERALSAAEISLSI